MNPFEQHQFNQDKEDNLPFHFPVQPRDVILVDRASRVEETIEKASGSLERSFKLIFYAAGLVTIAALSYPYLRLLWEFSKWSFKKVGQIFP